MSKRKTVRINMDLLDGYLKEKNIHPKDFCEKQLGFTDGWYYTIRKKGGRGVKVLSAQLIARITGIDYKTLVIPEEDTGRKTAAGASPRPTETREEKPLVIKYVEKVEELNGSKKTIGCLEKELDELKQERIQLLFTLDQMETDLKEADGDLKKLEKLEERLAVAERELKCGVMEIRYADLLPIMFFDLYGEDLNAEFVKGYLCALNSIFKHNDIRKEMKE